MNQRAGYNPDQPLSSSWIYSENQPVSMQFPLENMDYPDDDYEQ